MVEDKQCGNTFVKVSTSVATAVSMKSSHLLGGAVGVCQL